MLNRVDPAPRPWSWMLVRGVVAMIFGLVALFSPLATMQALFELFGVYLVLDGGLEMAAATTWWAHQGGTQPGWREAPGSARWLMAKGALIVVVGLITLLSPGVAETAVVVLWGVAALLTGVFEVWVGTHDARTGAGSSFLTGAGAISILFGAILLVLPGAGLVAVSWCLGLYALLFGFNLTATATGLRTTAASPDVYRTKAVDQPSVTQYDHAHRV